MPLDPETVPKSLRTLMRRVLYRLGYELRPVRVADFRPAFLHVSGELVPFHPTLWHPNHLRRTLPAPRTLVDVGVGRGTPSLYRSFPDAHLVFVEPLHEFDADVQRFLRQYRGEHVAAALGAAPGRHVLHVEQGTSDCLSPSQRQTRPRVA